MHQFRDSRWLVGGMVGSLALASALTSCSEEKKKRHHGDDDAGEAGADVGSSAGDSGRGGSGSAGDGASATGATGAGATGATGSGATGSGATGAGASGGSGAMGSGASGGTSSSNAGEAGESSTSGGSSSGGSGQCSGDECVGTCGDGRRTSDEECDDGNTDGDDGCSSACAVEEDFTCTGAVCEGDDGSCVVKLSATFRDFNAAASTGGHPDFEVLGLGYGAIQGLVQATLDADGKPVASASSADGFTSPASFAQWYRDEFPASGPIPGEIVLWDDGNGGFVNRWGKNGEQWVGYPDTTNIMYCVDGCAACGTPPAGSVCLEPCTVFGSSTLSCIIEERQYDGNPLFFPIDSAEGVLTDTRSEGKVPEAYGQLGWPWESQVATNLGITTPIETATAPFPAANHNFSFTTEVRFWFRYDAAVTQTLSFLGDDDVWVFVNGHLAIDLGAWHVPLGATLTFAGGTASSATAISTDSSGDEIVNRTDPVSVYELEDGEAYEVAVFHAERQKEGSSFKLGLNGFDLARSTCGRR